MSRRTWKSDSKKRSRCGHPHCTDCATRRGNNRGNRKTRHDAKAALRKLV